MVMRIADRESYFTALIIQSIVATILLCNTGRGLCLNDRVIINADHSASVRWLSGESREASDHADAID